MNCRSIVVLIGVLLVSAYARRLTDLQQRSLQEETRLFDFLSDFYGQVIYPPLNHIVTNLALLAAQVLAGISENGLPAPAGRIEYLSDEDRRNFFSDIWNNAIKPPIENALTGLSLLAAQMLAGVASNGVQLGKRHLSKEQMRSFADNLNSALNTVFTEVIQKPLEDALAGGALILAQMLAGLGTNGIDLSNLMGKRDINKQEELRGFFDTLSNNLLNSLQSVWSNVLQNPIEQALQNGALMAAQVLAGIGTNGIDLGKRQLNDNQRGEIIDNLLEHASGLYTSQVKPAIENALNAAALHLAELLANFGQNGFGRR